MINSPGKKHIILDCPHCLGDRVGFQLKHESKPDHLAELDVKITNFIYECGFCGDIVVWKYDMTVSPAIGDFYPARKTFDCPEYVTPKIQKELEIAFELLNESKAEGAEAKRASCALHCRRVLEMFCRDHNAPDGDLSQKLNYLQQTKAILHPIMEWAKTIRLMSNDPVHFEPEKISQTEINELYYFVKTFLINVYTIPSYIKKFELTKPSK